MRRHWAWLSLALALFALPGQADEYCCGCPADRGACERSCKSPSWCGGECGVVWCGTVGSCSGCSTHYHDGRHRKCGQLAAGPAAVVSAAQAAAAAATTTGAEDPITITLPRKQWEALFAALEARSLPATPASPAKP